jgi:hypothetical protein
MPAVEEPEALRYAAPTLPRRLVVGGLAAALALACTSARRSERTVLAGNPAQALLVLPLNVTAVMAPELESTSPAVWDELTAYLQDLGKQLKTVNPRVARQLWLGSIRKVRAGEKGAEAGFDDAAEAFVRELARHAEFDTVIAPSLFVREAQIAGREARWDGVSRPVGFEAHGLEAKRVVLHSSFEGKAPAASLHVVVLDAEGGKLQETLRGLELLVRVHVLEPRPDLPPDRRFEYVTRTDLFSDRESMRADIAEALAPFLPPLSAAAE